MLPVLSKNVAHAWSIVRFKFCAIIRGGGGHYEAILPFLATPKISAIESYWSHYLVQKWQHLTLMKGVIYE